MHVSTKSALTLAALATLGVAAVRPAAAQVFDFESTPATFTPAQGTRPGALTTLTLTSSGVSATFSHPNGARFDIVENDGNQGQAGKPAAFGLHSLDPFFDPTQQLLVNFSTGLTNVSFDFGDYGQDSDLLEVYAYGGLNGTGTFINSDYENYGTASFPTYGTASVSSAGFSLPTSIRSILVVGSSDAPGQVDSVFYDNFRVTLAPVPEASTVSSFGLLLALGAGGLVIAARRKRTAVQASSAL